MRISAYLVIEPNNERMVKKNRDFHWRREAKLKKIDYKNPDVSSFLLIINDTLTMYKNDWIRMYKI